MLIQKASGEKDIYDRNKLMRSMLRSGASEEDASRVADAIEEDLESGTSTRKIYRRAFQLLRRTSIQAASQYKLKQAVMQLGPSGYPFERFIGGLFEAKGYRVRVGQMLGGVCVNHEVDVIRVRDKEIILAECKFRNQPGSKSDVKVALYYHSRFRDLIDGYNGRKWNADWAGSPQHLDQTSFRGMIVTNAKFTEDAIAYALCSGLELLGWDYPANTGLLHMMRETGLLPITLLTTLSASDIQKILSENIVICRELRENLDVLEKLGIDRTRSRRVIAELDSIM